MLFNSIQFLLFCPVAVLGYHATPHRYRWVLLLIASYFFYACWKPAYLILIVLSTGVDYVAGIMMGSAPTKRRRLLYLVLSLCSNLGLLFFFKYYNFFTSSVAPLLSSLYPGFALPVSHLLLPVGLSFYTFQSLTYTIGVYRGVVTPERHLGIFAVYVCFWPQLVAGPIERAERMIPQFYERHTLNYDDMATGLRLVLWGLFKKVVIADRLAVLVNSAYNHAAYESGATLALATYFFAFQVYCDFSGYSDIAIGTARMIGFRLTTNFNKPYSAASITDFWRRWHISLSTWFRDFVYIPLGGNRVSQTRLYVNLMIVFVVSGLWHGANWTFLLWGALHGTYMVASQMSASYRSRVRAWFDARSLSGFHHALQVLITFHLVCFAWIFFRANTVHDAFLVVGKIATMSPFDIAVGSAYQFAYGLFGIVALLTFEAFQGAHPVTDFFTRFHPVHRWAFYVFCAVTILLIGVFDGGQFIYFQF